MDYESAKIVRDKLSRLRVIRDTEAVSAHPKWSLLIDPQSGIGIVTFNDRLLHDRREIHALVSTMELHLQNLSLELGTTGAT